METTTNHEAIARAMRRIKYREAESYVRIYTDRAMFWDYGDGTFTPTENPGGADEWVGEVIGDFQLNGEAVLLVEGSHTGDRFIVPAADCTEHEGMWL
jgi:hypothetical protein